MTSKNTSDNTYLINSKHTDKYNHPDKEKAKKLLLNDIEQWIKDMSKYSWEDVGNPKGFIELLTELKQDVEEETFFNLTITMKSEGMIDENTIDTIFKGQDAYYRCDGDFGGRDYKDITYRQLKLYLMCTIIGSIWEFPMEWESDYTQLLPFSINSNAWKELKKFADWDQYPLYHYCLKKMSKNTHTILQKMVKLRIEFTPKNQADIAEEALKDMDEEYEDYFGEVLDEFDIKCACTMGFKLV
jgi:hypothetical protein